MYDTLEAVRDDIVRRLKRAASDRNAPMHTPVIATADADARVMVLRDFDSESWVLRFHTDARAPKVGAIGEGAPVGALFYDKPAKVQIRVRGLGRILREGPEVDAAWAASTNYARRCYLGDGPGTAADAPTSGLPDWAEGKNPTDEQVAPASEHFALLLVQIKRADWFHLAQSGHCRAIFEGEHGRWVSP